LLTYFSKTLTDLQSNPSHVMCAIHHILEYMPIMLKTA
jgi:hypothetical protein